MYRTAFWQRNPHRAIGCGLLGLGQSTEGQSMLKSADRQRILDELRHLGAACDNAGHVDPELVWCEMRVSVKRLRELLPPDLASVEDSVEGAEASALRQLADFLDELWDTCRLGSREGSVEFPVDERPRGLIAWFSRKLAQNAPPGDADGAV